MNWNLYWTWALQVLAAIVILWFIYSIVFNTILKSRRDWHIQTRAIEDFYDDDDFEDNIVFSSKGDA
jgi:hypothetical protein